MAAFDAMDDECRHDNLVAMEWQARKYPRKSAAHLSLVHSASSASLVQLALDVVPNPSAPFFIKGIK